MRSQHIIAGEYGVSELVRAVEGLDPHEPHLVTIVPMRPSRTNEQNALMWVLLRMLAQGGDSWVMREEMLCRYFGFREVWYQRADRSWGVRLVPLVEHTSALDTETMAGFLEFLYTQVIEYGCEFEL